MRKVFCDKCNGEIKPSNARENLQGVKVPVARNNLTVGVEFSFNQNSKQLDHDICMHCIIDAVNRLDDRTREEPARFLDK